jgi:hypothetical protein
MIDYQFLGLVAVVLAVVTRGSVLPVLAMTALIGLVTVLYEAGVRRYRRRQAGPTGPIPPAESDLTRWMTVMDRMLRSDD